MVAEAKPGLPQTPLPKLAPGASSLAALSALTGPESSNLLIVCEEDGVAAKSLAQSVQEQLVMLEGVASGLGKDVDAPPPPAGEGVSSEDEKATPLELKCKLHR